MQLEWLNFGLRARRATRKLRGRLRKAFQVSAPEDERLEMNDLINHCEVYAGKGI